MPLENLPLPPKGEKPFVVPQMSASPPAPPPAPPPVKEPRVQLAPPTPPPKELPPMPLQIPEQPRPHHTPVGPTVGIVIIVLLLLLGALYLYGEHLNKAADPVPYIPGDQS